MGKSSCCYMEKKSDSGTRGSPGATFNTPPRKVMVTENYSNQTKAGLLEGPSKNEGTDHPNV